MVFKISTTASLESRFGPAGDQLGRPNCVSFAVSGAHQFLVSNPVLSVESAVHAAKLAGCRSASEATSIDHALLGLRSFGQCSDALWPYGAPAYPNVASGYHAAARYKRSFFVQLWPFTIEAIVDRLRRSPVILTVRVVTEAWEAAAATGAITIITGETSTVHAVLALESAMLPDSQAGVLIRNSWGRDWGTHGFAIASEEYLQYHLLRAHALQ
jgi:hypothetical protein